MPGGLLGGLSLFGSSWSWSSVGNVASTQFCLLIFILNSKFISDLTWLLEKISFFYPVTAGYDFYNTIHSNISILEGALLLPCYCIAGPAFTWLSSQQSSGRSSIRKLWMEFFCYHCECFSAKLCWQLALTESTVVSSAHERAALAPTCRTNLLHYCCCFTAISENPD